MSCRDTIHLICWYLEGKLSPTVEAEIAEHLRGCADCHLVLDAATTTLDRYFNTYEKATPDFVAKAWLGDAFAGQQQFRGRSTDRQQVNVPMRYLAEKDGAATRVASGARAVAGTWRENWGQG